MTFKEELIQISDRLEFSRRITNHCVMIKEYMSEAAKAGFRTFQIEVMAPTVNITIGTKSASNCYFVLQHDVSKTILAADFIEDYLINTLGFESVEKNVLNFNEYYSVRLYVRW